MGHFKITQRIFCQSAKCSLCVHGNGCDVTEKEFFSIGDLIGHICQEGNNDNIEVEEITYKTIFKN